ncbi:MAG TPA: hypothetical protein VFH43_14045 [Candidatus Kapabacteria bacterium]|jgi:hypothetical protein|nr:hypothetical protein [Candidatus Kapabacteria bacterium]
MKRIAFKDAAALAVASVFLFGCISSSQRTARTLQPKQVTPTVSIGMLTHAEAEEPIFLNDIGLHAGVAKGVELGIAHTAHLNPDESIPFSAFWFDSKFQLLNRDNEQGKVAISLGLSKGFVYDDDAEVHITSLPITFSTDLSARTSAFLSYRPEFVSRDFMPDGESTEDPRHSFHVGIEGALAKPDRERWTPRLNLSVGLVNKLAGGGDMDIFVVGLGLHLDSPF